MNKHAYLIMAHNNWNILELLLKSLDNEKNDFYLHIDSKVNSFDENKIKNSVNKSKLYFIDRKDVKWADYSQIDVTLDLLYSAKSNDNYSYYHLLSGTDMPIKSAEYIYSFFENSKKEFVGVASWGVKNMLSTGSNIIIFYPWNGG
ncbi:beta-1,6-N-acetylglucosaminyltransferase [Eubacterium sp.]|uniref:beta-1,6-N-acetylglucosaminyltransferase n=1 Tax=Eubacterium sp. TaxID=142586 RepID=UPI003F119EE5